MLITNNMYFAAYLMNEDMSIAGVNVAEDKTLGKTVEFRFSGHDDLHEKQAEYLYFKEQAQTNIRHYLENLVLVRDIIHKTMKKYERNAERETEPHTEKTLEKHIGRIERKNPCQIARTTQAETIS